MDGSGQAGFAKAMRGALADAARACDAARDDRPDLSGAFGALAEAGLLRAVLPAERGGRSLGIDPRSARLLCDLLRAAGRTDLSLARLFEGHVNAARLIETHGARPVREAGRTLVAEGAVLGVWGADGVVPLECVDLPGGRTRLEGGKRYASGLGLVTHAVVTARARPDGAPRMFLVPADDSDRHDPADWSATAMRATRSGGFDATDLEVGPDAAVGGPGDLMEEPHFEGGTWRYCAAHVGGAEALIGAWAAHLKRARRDGDPVQRHRLGRALASATAARAAVEAAAEAVEDSAGGSPGRIAGAVTVALLTREAVERLCVDVLALSERALGMGAHDARSSIDRMRRDLSLFLRQAAPDAKLDHAAAHVLGGTALEDLR